MLYSPILKLRDFLRIRQLADTHVCYLEKRLLFLSSCNFQNVPINARYSLPKYFNCLLQNFIEIPEPCSQQDTYLWCSFKFSQYRIQVSNWYMQDTNTRKVTDVITHLSNFIPCSLFEFSFGKVRIETLAYRSGYEVALPHLGLNFTKITYRNVGGKKFGLCHWQENNKS